MSQYPAQFRRLMLRDAQLLLNEIRADDAPMQRGDEAQAFHTLSYSLNNRDAWPIVREILLTLAPRLEQAGLRDEWIPYLEKGITESQTQHDIEAEAELHLQLGILFRLRGKYTEAHEQLGQSAERFAALDDGYNEARVFNQIAYLFRLERNFEKAKGYAKRAQEQLPQNDIETAYNFLVLGMIELDYDEPDKAEALFVKAHRILTSSDNQRLLGRCLLSLGISQRRQGRFQEALRSYKDARAIFALYFDELLFAIAQMNLGNVHLYLKNPSKSLKFYHYARLRFEYLQEQLQLANVNNNMGKAYEQLEEYKEAILSYQKSIELYLELRDYEQAVNAMDSLGVVYKTIFHLDKAREIFQKALGLLENLRDDPVYRKWDRIFKKRLEEL